MNGSVGCVDFLPSSEVSLEDVDGLKVCLSDYIRVWSYWERVAHEHN